MTGLPAKRGYLPFLSVLLAVLLVFALFAVTSTVFSQEMPFTLDFEAGDLRGWTKTGNAFDFQPTLDDNPTARKRGQPSQHQGRYWIGTYEQYQGKRGQKPGDIQGDGPTGTLTSASFTIPKGTLSFLVGGGAGDETRVELLVAGDSSGLSRNSFSSARLPDRVLSASARNSETMHRVTWELDAFAGKTGAIRIVDASSSGWGHINVDDFRFSSRETGTADGPSRPQAELPVQSTLSLRADRQKAQVNERVLFNATLSPPQANAQYLFSFGDFEVSNWTGQPMAEHVYRKEGMYRALATASVKGETVAESSPVNIVVENISERPVARIEPSQATVTQGERVIFASRSVPEGAIRERWKGPGNQQGTGRRFEVNTEQLGPGKYRIVLEAYDSHGQNDRAEATLVVVSPPATTPPTITPPTTTTEPKRFTLLMDAQPLPTRQSENVTFSARIEPGDETTEYRFFFGDGNIQEWSREARAVHVYAEAGSYHAYAAARIGQEVVAESVPVVISVEVKKPSSRIPWEEIIAGVLIASGYYVFSRIRKMRKKLSATRPVLHIRPALDSGEQEIRGDTHSGAGDGIRLKPVPDPGEPEIETKGLLTDDERRGDA